MGVNLKTLLRFCLSSPHLLKRVLYLKNTIYSIATSSTIGSFFRAFLRDTVHRRNFFTQAGLDDSRIESRVKEVSQKKGRTFRRYRCSDKTVSRLVSFDDSEIYVQVSADR